MLCSHWSVIPNTGLWLAEKLSAEYSYVTLTLTTGILGQWHRRGSVNIQEEVPDLKSNWSEQDNTVPSLAGRHSPCPELCLHILMTSWEWIGSKICGDTGRLENCLITIWFPILCCKTSSLISKQLTKQSHERHPTSHRISDVSWPGLVWISSRPSPLFTDHGPLITGLK